MSSKSEVSNSPEREIPNFHLRDTLRGHTSSIASVKFSPCGELLASCSFDSYIKLWNAADGKFVADLVMHKKGISDIAWSTDSSRLVSASDDKTLKIWDVAKEKCMKTLKGHNDVVFCTNFSPKANYVLSGSDDESAKLWDVSSGKCIKTFTPHGDRVTAFANSTTGEVDFPTLSESMIPGSNVDFDIMGRHFLTSSLDGFCHIHDIRSKGIIQSFGDGAPISFAKFSRNGKYVLAATLDNTITLWDYEKLRAVKVYDGHQNSHLSIFSDFSPGGKWVVSGSEDHKIYIWHLNYRYIAQLLEGHTDTVLCVSCHPSQNIIASGGLEEDKTVKIWSTR